MSTAMGGAEQPVDSPTAAMDAAAAQRPPLESAGEKSSAPVGAAAEPSSFCSSLPPALRCAADTVDVVFSFLSLKELPAAMRVCRQWLAVAQKGKARQETLLHRGQLAALCTSLSGSPLSRHIASIQAPDTSFAALPGLAALPALTSLGVVLDAAELEQLLELRRPQQALEDVRAVFPPQLRKLLLNVSDSRSTVAYQLLLDALPVMGGLEEFTLILADEYRWLKEPSFDSLSLAPLLHLPNLTRLRWKLDRIAVSQLQVIKQIPSLRHFHAPEFEWSMAQLAALCRPPHRLQQLEELDLDCATFDEATMAELAHLPGLTTLYLFAPTPATLAFLPRFKRLRCLDMYGRALQPADEAAVISSLGGCTALVDLTFGADECSEDFGGRLLQAVPLLRSLRFRCCSLPSLLFLRHAPWLEQLTLDNCKGVRPGHLVNLGSSAPQLQRLTVERCAGLDLSEAAVQRLTPPAAPALPSLQAFRYVPAPTHG